MSSEIDIFLVWKKAFMTSTRERGEEGRGTLLIVNGIKSLEVGEGTRDPPSFERDQDLLHTLDVADCRKQR